MIDYYTLIPNFKKIIPKFLDKKNLFAVVGDFKKSEHAVDVLKTFKKQKYNFEIVDPNCEEIEGKKCFDNLEKLPKKPDIVCITTPSDKTEGVAKECLKLGIKMVWMEPGSESDEAVEFCKSYYIDAIYHHSIIKEQVNPTAEEEFLKKHDI